MTILLFVVNNIDNQSMFIFQNCGTYKFIRLWYIFAFCEMRKYTCYSFTYNLLDVLILKNIYIENYKERNANNVLYNLQSYLFAARVKYISIKKERYLKMNMKGLHNSQIVIV